MNVSKQLINGFITKELSNYKTDFNLSPVPDIQDQRSLSIAWLCHYFSQSITEENSSAIIKFVDDVMEQPDYSYNGWYKISALQAAAFILTFDVYYSNSLIQHLDCSQGWARGFIVKSAAIISPLLSFNNDLLRKVTESNLQNSHAYYEANIILYLTTKGTTDDKKKWLELQIKSDERQRHTTFFNEIINAGKYYQNEYFVGMFNNVKSFIIFSMLGNPILASIQPDLFEEAKPDFKILTDTENQHPLNNNFIDFSFLNATK